MLANSANESVFIPGSGVNLQDQVLGSGILGHYKMGIIWDKYRVCYFLYQDLQMNLLLSMSNPQDPGTLLEFVGIFSQKEFWKNWVPPVIKDVRLENLIKYTLPEVDYLSSNRGKPLLGDYIRSKFDDLVFDPRLRLMFGQKKSTISFRQIMDEGKILLLNLAKGEIPEENSKFLGMFIMSKIVNATMSRVDIPKKERKNIFLICG